MSHRIVSTNRCIFPGPKAVLMGYDSDGKEAFGIPIKTKNIAAWTGQGTKRADLKRLRKDYDKFSPATASKEQANGDG